MGTVGTQARVRGYPILKDLKNPLTLGYITDDVSQWIQEMYLAHNVLSIFLECPIVIKV